MTEIEIRGKLLKADFDRLFALLEKSGEIKNHYHRLSVDISSGFNEATKSWDYSSLFDLRIKKSDDKEKITMKVGSYDQKKRKEIEVKLLPGEMANALRLFEVMGYKLSRVWFTPGKVGNLNIGIMKLNCQSTRTIIILLK